MALTQDFPDYEVALTVATTGISYLRGVTGAGASVRSSLPFVNLKDYGVVADCTDIGVGTDIIPTLSAKIVEIVTAVGDGAHIVLPYGRYRGGSAAIIDLQGKQNVTIEFMGVITPDAEAMTMLTFRNARGLRFRAALYKGGVFNGWGDPSPYATTTYYTQADVVTGGGCEAFLFQGVFDCTVDISAYAYAGRVMRTTERSSVSHPQTGAFKGHIQTMRDQDLNGPRIAQALWADGGAVVGTGNWGNLTRITSDFDYWGPVWKDLNDIEINVIDAAYSESGPEFRGCVVVEGDNWYIGDIDGNASNTHVSFIPSAARACENARVTKMRFLNAGNGLLCDELLLGDFSDIRMTGSGYTDLVTLTDCQDVRARMTGTDGARLAVISGAATNKVHVSPMSYGTLSSDHVVVDGTVTGKVFIENPVLETAAATKALIKIDGTPIVHVVDPELNSATGNLFDIASASNNVFIFGGRVAGAATVFESSVEPVIIHGVSGLNSKVSGTIRSNDGGNSGGAGGAYDFGISAAGLTAYTPMAKVKGKLTNSTGTELQGGISLQFRPTGAAGQSLVDGLELSHTTTDGETVGILLVRDTGAYVAKRITQGADDSGGAGFAVLRVAN